MVKKIIKDAIEDVQEELNEPVETFTVRKSWLVVAAVVVTVLVLAVIVL